MKGLILDAGATKAWRVLKARLGRLGYDVMPNPSGLPDEVLDNYRLKGYVIVSTDKDALKYGWIYIPQVYVERKSSRDLASHITKIVFKGGPMSPRGSYQRRSSPKTLARPSSVGSVGGRAGQGAAKRRGPPP